MMAGVTEEIAFRELPISYMARQWRDEKKTYRLRGSDAITSRLEKQPVIIVVTWSVFVLEMVLRFFPSRFESPGCQKQFGRNYIKSGETNIIIHDNNATLLIALIWIVFNGFIGALRMRNILDDGILILICSAYSVCDMISYYEAAQPILQILHPLACLGGYREDFNVRVECQRPFSAFFLFTACQAGQKIV